MQITDKDLASLNNENWLTDNIIHVFLSTYIEHYNIFVFPYAFINFILENGQSRNRTRIVRTEYFTISLYYEAYNYFLLI